MNRLMAWSSVLVSALLEVACGAEADTVISDPGAAVGGGGTGGVGGAAAGGADAGGRNWLYDSEDEGVFTKSRVLDIQVTMTPEAWEQLIATAKREVWSTAEVSIDGQELGEIGIRPKGEYSLDSCVDSSGQLLCEKLSLKLKFNAVDAEGRFYGLKRLALNQILDAGNLYAETLAYQVFNDFGIEAPRTSYATVTVNGESLGIYRVVEVVDGRFTKEHFDPGEGNLYKEAWPVSSSEGYYAGCLETNEETATHEGFVAFASELQAASDEELPGVLAKYMDVGQTLDYMAVDYAVANWDGITTFYAGSWGQQNHNFYMYQREGTSKFTLIPWDLNATFFLDHWLGDIQPWDTLDVDCEALVPTEDSEGLFTAPASCDPLIRAIALSKDGYRASVRRLLDEVFVSERLGAMVDGYAAQVDAAMKSDPFLAYGEVAGGAQYIKGQIATMRTRLETVLGQD